MPPIGGRCPPYLAGTSVLTCSWVMPGRPCSSSRARAAASGVFAQEALDTDTSRQPEALGPSQARKQHRLEQDRLATGE